MSEIRKLTRWQVRNIAFHPRDKEGRLRRRPRKADGRRDPFGERFLHYFTARNLPRHVAAAKARADLAPEGDECRTPP